MMSATVSEVSHTIGGATLDALTLGADASLPGAEIEEALAAGTTVNGRYKILRTLGHGGGGWVYDVADALFPSRAVALKIAHGRAQDQARLSLFKVEFSTMTKLDHPNVARVYDFEELRGGSDFLITMERIDGEPVSRALGGAGDWKKVVDLIVPVCRALSYIHSRRIVHYDLKPQNILVTATGEVKVVDFGIAAGPSAHDGRVMGTLPYMPPELLLGEGSADYRADLYSLGITIFELLFGCLPCPHSTPYEIVRWMDEHGVRVPARDGLPSWLARLIEKLCAKDPADRYRHANAVIEEINLCGGFSYPFETSETQRSYITSPRFCGRQQELERVMGFVAERLTGRGGVISALWVHGVSGIGKSRLMKEARQAAQLQRLVFIEGNCYENSPVEYGPIAEVLSQLVPIVEMMGGLDIVGETLPALVKIAPGLAKSRTYTPLPKATDAEGERVQLLTIASEFFVRAAERVPFVVYLNDMQWAGKGPAEMFSYIAQRAGDDESEGQRVRFALIGSYRSDEVEGRPLARAVETLQKRNMATEVELAPLGAEQVATVVRSMLGVDDIPGAFLARVTDETLGNPFFVQEVMRELFENGSIFLEGGRWAARQSIDALQIPSTMADVFRRRLSLLSGDERELVRVLAVHGRPLELDRIAEVLGDRMAIADRLRELERSMIVVPHRGRAAAYNIAHDRMRETAYGDLAGADRQALHQRLAAAIERASAALEEKDRPLDDLARHYRDGALADKALTYSIVAGKRALERFSNEAATEHLGHALALLPAGDVRQAELEEAFADGLMRVHRFEDALARYRALLSRLSSKFERARVQGKLGEIFLQTGRLREAEEAGWGALEDLGQRRPRGFGWIVRTCLGLAMLFLSRAGVRFSARPVQHSTFVASVYRQVGWVYSQIDQIRALATMVICWRAFAGTTDRVARSIVSGGIGAMIGMAGFKGIGFALLREAVAEGERSGSETALGNACNWLGILQRYEGDRIAELEVFTRASNALARTGDLYLANNARIHIADSHWKAGQMDAAVREATQCRQHTLRFAKPPVAASLLALEGMYRTHQMRTEPAEIDALFAEAEAIAVAANNTQALQQAIRMRGMSRCAEGRVEEAIVDLERAVAERKTSGDLTNYTFDSLVRLTRAYLLLDVLSPARSRTLARLHRRVMRQTKTMHKNHRPSALINEALRRERRGERAAADRAFAEAIALARAYDTLFFATEALYLWGLARKKSGDRARAEEHLREARRIGSDGGNRLLVVQCDAALQAIAAN
jgi:tetratricopeptide (TPR) repeat protein